jgi:hypothetical protein
MNRHAILGIAIFAAIALAVGGGIVLARSLGQTVPLDAETLCPTDRPLAAHTVVLVDRTDPLTPAHQAALRRLITKLRDRLDRAERLSILLITGEVRSTATVAFSLCNPGTGIDLNPLVANQRRARARFEAGFGQPLEVVVRDLARAASANHSPIMETIKAVGAWSEFAAPRRNLIVVSDLLQNVPGYGHYGRAVDYIRFKASTYAATVRPELDGVDIELLYLPNPAGRQGRDHLAFWEAFFRDAGAASVTPVRP